MEDERPSAGLVGCAGCLGCLGMLVLIPLLAIFATPYWWVPILLYILFYGGKELNEAARNDETGGWAEYQRRQRDRQARAREREHQEYEQQRQRLIDEVQRLRASRQERMKRRAWWQ